MYPVMQSDFLNRFLSLDCLQRDSGLHFRAEPPPLPRSHSQLRFRGRDSTPYSLVRILGITSSNGEDSKPAIEVITGFGVELREPEGANASPSLSTCEPFQEVIQLGLSRGRNARAIWQDLVSDHGFGAGYQSVRRFIYKLRGSQTPQARAVILTVAGEEAQVDYGSGPMVRDPQSGKYRRTRLFVMTLGYSRKSVRLLTFRSSSRLWAELHE